MQTAAHHPSTSSKTTILKRLAPVAIVIAALALVFGLGLHRYLSFEQLRLHRGELMAYVATMPTKALLLFILTYACATSLSLPGGAVLTLTGGFLFGTWVGTGAVVFGATLGAVIVFVAARTVFADALRAKAGPWLAKMQDGFKSDAFSYLLVLRLVPGFPFFVVNLVPALLGVPLRTFAVTTFLGIIPGTFVFASIGDGLGSIFDQMQEFSLKGALTPQVITALLGLAALSLLPIIYKRWKGKI